MLFAEGRNAVQVQRWLGHPSAASTLSTYVHLLDDGIGEPLALPACEQKCEPDPAHASTDTQADCPEAQGITGLGTREHTPAGRF